MRSHAGRFPPSCYAKTSRMPAYIGSRLPEGRFYRTGTDSIFDALECRHKRRQTQYALSQKFALLVCKAMKIVLPEAFPVVLALLFMSGKLCAQSTDTLIGVGDLFYAKLQAHEALKYYLPAEKLERKIDER